MMGTYAHVMEIVHCSIHFTLRRGSHKGYLSCADFINLFLAVDIMTLTVHNGAHSFRKMLIVEAKVERLHMRNEGCKKKAAH